MAQVLRLVENARPAPRVAQPPAPKRRIGLRAKLSRARALILTAMGVPRGFFTQYPYAEHLQPVGQPYPEVAALFEAAPWGVFLEEITAYRDTLATFMEGSGARLGRGMFPAIDGMAAYTAVREFRPRRILEVGSGDSTYFLAAGVKHNGSGAITCIDPKPRRAIIDLNVDFRPRLMNNGDAELAATLESNDILFIDSSHIMLPGMDVDIQFNRLFPRLKRGVIVHVHDIFLPDDYPPHWRVRNYSEQNALIGWLISNYFEIIWPGQYVVTRHADAVHRALGDLGDVAKGGSLWLRKT
jgi:predicted O-methyltransferase YrrM